MQKILTVGLVAVSVAGSVVLAAQGQGERVTVNFSDPSRPGLLQVQHDGREHDHPRRRPA